MGNRLRGGTSSQEDQQDLAPPDYNNQPTSIQSGQTFLVYLDDQTRNFALKKLTELSKDKFQQQISYYDLLVMLQKPEQDIKSLFYLLQGSVSRSAKLNLNTLQVALLMSCEDLVQDAPKLIQTLIDAVCYQVDPEKVQFTEISYLLDLVSQILVALSDQEQEDPLQIVDCIDKIQESIKFKFFMQIDQELSVIASPKSKKSKSNVTSAAKRNESEEERESEQDLQQEEDHIVYKTLDFAPLKDIQEWVLTQNDVRALFGLDLIKSEADGGSEEQLQSSRIASSERENQQQVSARVSLHSKNSKRTRKEDESQKQDQISKISSAQANKENHSRKNAKEQAPNLNILPVASSENDNNQEQGQNNNLNSNRSKQQPQQQQSDRPMFIWGTDHLKLLNQMFKSESETLNYDIDTIESTEMRLKQLCLENEKALNGVDIENINDLMEKFAKVEDLNMEDFGKHQVSQMMSSKNLIDSLQLTNFSILHYAKTILAEKKAKEEDVPENNNDNQSDHVRDREFEDSYTKAIQALLFQECFKAQISQLKLQKKMYKARTIQYLNIRGDKRITEKKRAKALGEIEQLFQILKLVDQNRQRNDTRVSTPRPNQNWKSDSPFQEVPTRDQLCRLAFMEVNNLFQVGLSRRELLTNMLIKQEKAECAASVSFWQGVIEQIQAALDICSFKELDFFKQFFRFANLQLKTEEKRYVDLVIKRVESKGTFNRYLNLVGNLKGLNLALHLESQYQGSPEEFITEIKERIQTLTDRMEKIDLKETVKMQQQLEKQRGKKILFKTSGQLAMYSCVTKGLSMDNTFDFLKIELCKMRVIEVVNLIARQDCYLDPNPKTDQSFLASVYKIQKIAELDRYAQYVKNVPNPLQKKLEIQQFAKFQDELDGVIEEQRLMANAPDYPFVQSLESKTTQAKPFIATVKAILTKFYSKFDGGEAKLKQFGKFAKEQLTMPMFTISGKLMYKSLESDDMGQKLFDFVDLSVKKSKEQKADDTIQWMGSLSKSLEQTYFNGPVEQLITVLKQSHVDCMEFLGEMKNLTEPDFIDAFKDARVQIFDTFIKQLQKANKGHLMNNLDLRFLSLPLEYSLENNFWIVMTLTMQIRHFECEEQFSQLLTENSEILLSRRALCLNKKVAAALILAAFDCGPQKIDFSDSEDDYEQGVAKDRLDFQKQFKILKERGGKPQDRVKNEIFSEIYQAMFLQLEQINHQKAVIDTYGQLRESQNTIEGIVAQLAIDSMDTDKVGDLNEILERYRYMRERAYNTYKRQCVTQIIGGAGTLLAKQIKNQTSSQNYGQNQTLENLKKYLENAKNLSLALTEKQENGGLIADKQNKNAEMALISFSTANNNAAEVSFVNESQKTGSRGTIKKGKKGKVIKKKSPLGQAESDLMGHLSKIYQIQTLIAKSQNCNNKASNFYYYLDQESVVLERLKDKMQVTLQFLQANIVYPEENNEKPLGSAKGSKSENTTLKGLMLNVEGERFGAKMIQKVQIGRYTQPFFVYSPPDAENIGIPPPMQIKSDSVNNSILKGSQNESMASMAKTEDQSGSKKEILTAHKQAVNMVLQFIVQLALNDDLISLKQSLYRDQIFYFVQMLRSQIQHTATALQIQDQISPALHQIVNVFSVQQTPTEDYLQKFDSTTKLIQRDLLMAVQSADKQKVYFQLYNQMGKNLPRTIKHVVGRLEEYFSLMELDESDKLDLITAQTKIKRELDQRLSTYKEHIDLEQNKLAAKSHMSLIHHQEQRILQEITYSTLLIRMFYLKMFMNLKTRQYESETKP